MALFPLLGLTIWWMLPPFGVVSRVSKAALILYMPLYVALDAVLGLGSSVLVQYRAGLAPSDRAGADGALVALFFESSAIDWLDQAASLTWEIAALAAALDHVFAEPETGPPAWVKAIVVVKDGRVIAERYVPGVGIDTPLPGYSLSKTTINALIGILVGEGKLQVAAPAPVAAWADPASPRHAITLDNLLRMTSGSRIFIAPSTLGPRLRSKARARK